MKSPVVGVLLGPLIIIAFFLGVGDMGIVVAMFVAWAALVYIPVFAIFVWWFQVSSLFPLVVIANSIPFVIFTFNCHGKFSLNCSLSADAAQPYYAVTFCAFVYWLFVRK